MKAVNHEGHEAREEEYSECMVLFRATNNFVAFVFFVVNWVCAAHKGRRDSNQCPSGQGETGMWANDSTKKESNSTMTKSLETLTKSVKDRARGIGKYLAVGAALGSSYFAGNNAYADKFVNNSMNVTTINSIIASASSGEPVHYNEGTYQINFGEPSYLVESGARLIADGVVTLRGPTPTSGVVVRLNSVNSGISGFIIENSAKGISSNANFIPSSPIHITSNTIQNVDTAISWTNKDVVGDNMLPSVIVDTNYIRAVFAGSIFDDQSAPQSGTTAWAKVSNNTFEQVSGVVYSPPLYATTTAAGTTIIVLGLGYFDGNIIIDMNGVTLPGSVLNGIPGPISNTAAAGIPDANGEMDIANNPAPGYSWGGQYLRDIWGGNNVASANLDDAVISWSKRPIYRRPGNGPSSPFVGDGKCTTPNGSERHYCGAFPPMGDVNADGVLDDTDQSALLQKMTGPGVQAPDADRKVFDFDGDGDIDNSDLGEFIRGYVGSNPVIPATSTWGLAVLALASLIGGTLILRRSVAVYPRRNCA